MICHSVSGVGQKTLASLRFEVCSGILVVPSDFIYFHLSRSYDLIRDDLVTLLKSDTVFEQISVSSFQVSEDAFDES